MKGEAVFSIAKVDPTTKEIAGVFESVQPSDTDLGAKAPKDVKITGLWCVEARGRAGALHARWPALQTHPLPPRSLPPPTRRAAGTRSCRNRVALACLGTVT